MCAVTGYASESKALGSATWKGVRNILLAANLHRPLHPDFVCELTDGRFLVWNTKALTVGVTTTSKEKTYDWQIMGKN